MRVFPATARAKRVRCVRTNQRATQQARKTGSETDPERTLAFRRSGIATVRIRVHRGLTTPQRYGNRPSLARETAVLMDSSMLSACAIPCPAMSKAVP